MPSRCPTRKRSLCWARRASSERMMGAAKTDPEIAMATHPVEPEPLSPGPEPAAPNPSQLPVEPDFGPMAPPAEPEDPGVKHPHP